MTRPVRFSRVVSMRSISSGCQGVSSSNDLVRVTSATGTSWMAVTSCSAKYFSARRGGRNGPLTRSPVASLCLRISPGAT